MEPLKRKPSGKDEVSTLEVKRARENLLPQLPPEIWELIFRNLTGHWLRLARLACSSWNQIIHGSTRLMEKFVLTLTEESFEKDRKFVRALLATGGGYTRASFAIDRIGIHKPRLNWFVPLGTTLHTLSVRMNGSLALLVQILKEMPNLKKLDVVMSRQSPVDVVPDFQHGSLEELSIYTTMCPARLMRSFRQICSQLKVLRITGSSSRSNGDYEQELVALVFEVRKSLRELEVNLSDGIVAALETMEDLRLERAVILGGFGFCLRLIRSQPSLVSLDISQGFENVDISTFNEVLATRPKMKTLLVRLESDRGNQRSLTFQSSLDIETLSIKYGHAMIPPFLLLNLSVENLQNVQKLKLSRCNLSDHFMQVLQRTTISSLTLKNCRLARLADLLPLQSLQHIELGLTNIENMTLPEPDGENRLSVRSLKVTKQNRGFLLAVIDMFQNLEQFDAGSGVDINEAVLRELSLRSQRLKELRFSGCNFASNCPADAVSLFKSLEKFYIQYNYRRQQEIAAAMQDVRGGIELKLKSL